MTLHKINRIVNFLRYTRGYKYKQIQQYFINEYAWTADQFETMMCHLDASPLE